LLGKGLNETGKFLTH